MVQNTRIEWATHTFSPWTGCTKVSAACDHCYAEAWAKRAGRAGLWHGERARTTASYWRQPLKWNREAAAAGVRPRVFCASLSDVFDNQVPPAWRQDMWALIADTPHLDWLLLTKRPQNIKKMLPGSCVEQMVGRDLPWPWPNVWLGTTVENQAEADRRIPIIASVPAQVRFLSCEPLLGPVDLGYTFSSGYKGGRPAVDWVIAGGESGPGARPSHPRWFLSLLAQCQVAGIPFHFKQWGEWHPYEVVPGGDLGGLLRAGKVDVVHLEDHTDAELCTRSFFRGDVYVRRVGKKNSGRLLDGREWDEFPRAA